ncbi:MAG: RHS repeat-associated core domain-containing protein, partial [Terriglobales bacterium]
DSDLGLYYLRARYYNMLSGRFESMDPAAGSIFEPPSLHKYAYTWDNPVNAIDPRGRDDIPEYIFDWKLEINMLNREAQFETGKFGFEFLHAFHFAHSLGECDEAGLQLTANALASLTDSPQEAPSEEFPNCIPKALWNILNPIPWVPFPPYPGQ